MREAEDARSSSTRSRSVADAYASFVQARAPPAANVGVSPAIDRHTAVAASAPARWSGHCRLQTSSRSGWRCTSHPNAIAVP